MGKEKRIRADGRGQPARIEKVFTLVRRRGLEIPASKT